MPFRLARQEGMTLVECLVSLAISAIVLAGTTHLLSVGLQSYEAGMRSDGQRARAEIVMRRIAWAMEMAVLKKQGELPAKTDPTTSGVWFDQKDASGNKVVFRYDWSSATQMLSETEGNSNPLVLLKDVTDFSVTAPGSTDAALVTVSLTIGEGPERIHLTETRRLGGQW